MTPYNIERAEPPPIFFFGLFFFLVAIAATIFFPNRFFLRWNACGIFKKNHAVVLGLPYTFHKQFPFGVPISKLPFISNFAQKPTICFCHFACSQNFRPKTTCCKYMLKPYTLEKKFFSPRPPQYQSKAKILNQNPQNPIFSRFSCSQKILFFSSIANICFNHTL